MFDFTRGHTVEDDYLPRVYLRNDDYAHLNIPFLVEFSSKHKPLVVEKARRAGTMETDWHLGFLQARYLFTTSGSFCYCPCNINVRRKTALTRERRYRLLS